MTTVWTIGYENATVPRFIDTLAAAGVELVVDVRAVASSRRPGFAKTRLTENLAEAGIGYLHLRGLGTPSDGRAAGRAGRHDELRRIFADHLDTPGALHDMDRLVELVTEERRVCLLCLEANPEHCHRTLVADALTQRVAIDVVHLDPGPSDD